VKLYDRFGARGFHSSFITTFGIDFDAYENICLNRLRGAGCTNNFVLPDARMLSYALDGASQLPRYAGRLYVASGMRAPRGGVFHSKLFLRMGRRMGELLVGSANMTAPGLAGNRELMGMVECGLEETGERRIIASAWSYLKVRLDQTLSGVQQQLTWMQSRSPWLADTEPAVGQTTLRDHSQAAFLTSDDQLGIAQQFIALVAERPVSRLIVISPYWDEGLTALKHLIAQLAPRETILLIEPKRRLFPAAALKDLPNLKLADISALDPLRFFHAKAIIAQTGQADHVLFGSANCTTAALGTTSYHGINEEACLYRRLPPQAAIQSLAIEKLLTDEHAVDGSTLKPLEQEDELNLSEQAQRDPGRFECIFDTLMWWPPEGTANASAIELLDADSNELAAPLMPLETEPPLRRFRLANIKERPAFARLKYLDGKTSARAIVTLSDALKHSAKEARSKRAEAAASLLSEETYEGFWMLEALDVLEAAEEQGADDAKTITRKRSNADKSEPPTEHHRTLDYENFIAGRQLRSEGGMTAPSSLAGSELSLVRGFLNRILGIDRPDETYAEIQKDEDLSGAFDLGDETADAQRAIEGGEEFAAPIPKIPKDQDLEKINEKLKRERRKAHADQIIAAVSSFDERIHKRAATGHLSAIDVLRLRALIVVVAAAGYGNVQASADDKRSPMQAFPATGEVNSWPRLLGRVLFIFFGGNKPAIHALRLDASFAELTADIKESWATSFWAIQICLDATRRNRGNANLMKSLEGLAQRLYAITQLQDAELTGIEITNVIKAMNDRYAQRLGFDPDTIERAQLNEIAKLHSDDLGRGRLRERKL
jgi:hypothetical protein